MYLCNLLTCIYYKLTCLIILSVDLTVLKCDVQLLLDLVDNTNAEMACEAECHKLIQEGHIFNFGCPLVCHAYDVVNYTSNKT